MGVGRAVQQRACEVQLDWHHVQRERRSTDDAPMRLGADRYGSESVASYAQVEQPNSDQGDSHR